MSVKVNARKLSQVYFFYSSLPLHSRTPLFPTVLYDPEPVGPVTQSNSCFDESCGSMTVSKLMQKSV